MGINIWNISWQYLVLRPNVGLICTLFKSVVTHTYKISMDFRVIYVGYVKVVCLLKYTKNVTLTYLSDIIWT